MLAQEVAQPGGKIGPDISHVAGFTEMKLHGERWNRPTFSSWQAEVVSLNNIIDKRRNIAKNQLIAFFGLSQSQVQELFPND